MKKLLFIALTLVSTLSFAANAAPFGQEVGVAKCKDVIKNMSDKVKFTQNGVNKFTNGPMYVGDADNLGFDGAKSILLICDQSDVLSALQLTLAKGSFSEGFDKYSKMLKAKYKQVKMVNPYVGNKYAKYSQGNSIIELDAPHLSFDMALTYETNQFDKSYKDTTTTEKNNKQKQQMNNL